MAMDIMGMMKSLGASPTQLAKGYQFAKSNTKNPLQPTQEEVKNIIKNSDLTGLEPMVRGLMKNPKVSQAMRSTGYSEDQILEGFKAFGLIGGNGNSKPNNAKSSLPTQSSQKYNKYR